MYGRAKTDFAPLSCLNPIFQDSDSIGCRVAELEMYIGVHAIVMQLDPFNTLTSVKDVRGGTHMF